MFLFYLLTQLLVNFIRSFILLFPAHMYTGRQNSPNLAIAGEAGSALSQSRGRIIRAVKPLIAFTPSMSHRQTILCRPVDPFSSIYAGPLLWRTISWTGKTRDSPLCISRSTALAAIRSRDCRIVPRLHHRSRRPTMHQGQPRPIVERQPSRPEHIRR